MIGYIIEFAILHLLFYSAYKMLLAKETQLQFLRFFLVGSTSLSLILPAIDIPTKAAIPTVNMNAIVLPALSVTEGEATQVLPWYIICLGIISLIFLIKVVINLVQIYGWYKQSEREVLEEIAIRKVPGLQNSFTFFQWIFIDPKNFEHPTDIVRHEQGHAKKLHSLDLLFFHALTILFWWVPSIWLMMRELKEVHEYEADDFAIKISDTTYRKTLVHCTLRAHGMNLASSFDDAPIFNRLNFMKKMKKKISIWKVASIAAIVAISGVLFACEEELESELVEIIEDSNQQIEHTDDVQAILDQLAVEKPGEKFAVIETTFENEASIQKLNAYDPEQIEHIIVKKEGDVKSVVMIVNQSSDIFNKTIEIQEVRGDDIFTIVEEAASFPGGTKAFNDFLASNMKYPTQARRLGIQGQVFIEFIVEPDGSLTNMHIVKGIGAGCDAEALRIMTNSPKWEPGSQRGKLVRQKMVQPIQFKLKDE